jgi:putative tryptophan/tyrosine transport system substrate-binding protein
MGALAAFAIEAAGGGSRYDRAMAIRERQRRTMLHRRAFVVAAVAGAVVGPATGGAEHFEKAWRIGVLTTTPRPAPDSPHYYNDFVRELRDLGYHEGRNTMLEWRHTDAELERGRREAIALVQWRPHVVVTANGGAALAVRDATAAIPIVVVAGGDLVALGLATSLARPGGTVTGLQVLSPELSGKRLQLLTELLPRTQRVALLHESPRRPEAVAYWDRVFADLDAAARPLRIQASRVVVASNADFERAFVEMKGRGVQAVVIPGSALFNAHADQIAKLMVHHRLPAIQEDSSHVRAGGLVSYGYRQADLFRRAAHYVDRILKGAAPANLPIEQATQFELTVNLKTARALGLTVPQSVLARADHVVE